MGLRAELEEQVKKTFRERWTTRPGRAVPTPGDIGLWNDAVTFESATVLYADLADSTGMVLKKRDSFAAEIYKNYLYVAARIIRSEGGEITAYDGDRVMAVFIGDNKNTSAARSALKINYAVIHIINAALVAQYPESDFRVRQVVGIDTSSQFVARTGVRGDNDLVWVGRAANYAAKLTALPPEYPTRITESVYTKLHASVKTTNGRQMWERVTWNATNVTIYRSNWWWPFD
jgi:class 3 adenylate cyclase